VPRKVIDTDDGNSQSPGQAASIGNTDEKAADQPGPSRHSDAVDVLEREASLAKGLFDDDFYRLEMMPCGDLGHDPSVGRVGRDLRSDDGGEHIPARIEDRCRGLVAGGLDAEDSHPETMPCLFRAFIPRGGK